MMDKSDQSYVSIKYGTTTHLNKHIIHWLFKSNIKLTATATKTTCNRNRLYKAHLNLAHPSVRQNRRINWEACHLENELSSLPIGSFRNKKKKGDRCILRAGHNELERREKSGAPAAAWGVKSMGDRSRRRGFHRAARQIFTPARWKKCRRHRPIRDRRKDAEMNWSWMVARVLIGRGGGCVGENCWCLGEGWEIFDILLCIESWLEPDF